MIILLIKDSDIVSCFSSRIRHLKLFSLYDEIIIDCCIHDAIELGLN